MTAYQQLTFTLDRMDGHASALESSLARQSDTIGAVMREVRNAGFTPHTPAATRPQAQETAMACPLCKGTMDGDTCTRCGMAVLR